MKPFVFNTCETYMLWRKKILCLAVLLESLQQTISQFSRELVELFDLCSPLDRRELRANEANSIKIGEQVVVNQKLVRRSPEFHFSCYETAWCAR